MSAHSKGDDSITGADGIQRELFELEVSLQENTTRVQGSATLGLEVARQ